MSNILDVQRHSVHTLVFRSLKRTHDMFLSNRGGLPPTDPESEKLKLALKAKSMYSTVMDQVDASEEARRRTMIESSASESAAEDGDALNQDCTSLAVLPSSNNALSTTEGNASIALMNPVKKIVTMAKPKWHAPWKLYRVISGHLGWVRCCAVEPGNEWFATGASDRIIKIWDLASGKLRISLTGHISTVRGLAVSANHPYLFSCGEDKQVKCWDLEYNKVIRHYHGHLSAVYTIAMHPSIDVLVTAGRDATARVWDMRTKTNVHTLTGHTNTVASVVCQQFEPQVITGSHDSTVRLWDLAAGKSRVTLTHHKKSIRAVTLHPTLNMFASASSDNIKQWKCPDGQFIQNLSGHNAIVNCLAANEDGVLISGADNGSMCFWDWRTGYNFQRSQAPVQPGSMDSEAGVFSITFDLSGTRMITTDADKTIKIYKEDEAASEETHPINWKPNYKRRKY